MLLSVLTVQLSLFCNLPCFLFSPRLCNRGIQNTSMVASTTQSTAYRYGKLHTSILNNRCRQRQNMPNLKGIRRFLGNRPFSNAAKPCPDRLGRTHFSLRCKATPDHRPKVTRTEHRSTPTPCTQPKRTRTSFPVCVLLKIQASKHSQTCCACLV